MARVLAAEMVRRMTSPFILERAKVLAQYAYNDMCANSLNPDMTLDDLWAKCSDYFIGASQASAEHDKAKGWKVMGREPTIWMVDFACVEGAETTFETMFDAAPAWPGGEK